MIIPATLSPAADSTTAAVRGSLLCRRTLIAVSPPRSISRRFTLFSEPMVREAKNSMTNKTDAASRFQYLTKKFNFNFNASFALISRRYNFLTRYHKRYSM
jgi:hypothetical protein